MMFKFIYEHRRSYERLERYYYEDSTFMQRWIDLEQMGYVPDDFTTVGP
jgi:hypothetical protein